ncbi:hypothetical protein ZIOFF_020391 [Zingiber officinale]|uniref:Uncharacterized protein n=1 Tax=Zingiber officinale TaxID=94328 RepID=A0A8J5GY90_ZINOF|nr:hypothetical protein ZIOFF_020391 [Zingiber officinale]
MRAHPAINAIPTIAPMTNPESSPIPAFRLSSHEFQQNHLPIQSKNNPIGSGSHDRSQIQKRATAAADGSRSPPSLAMALAPPVVATLCPSFFASPSAHPRLTFPPNPPAIRHRPPASYPRVRALDLDQDTLVAISVGVVSVAVGIAIPVFYESQIDNAAKRENSQPSPSEIWDAVNGASLFSSTGFTVLVGPPELMLTDRTSILQLSWNWFLSEQCRFCTGSGKISVALGGENEVSQCINCDGAGTLTCTTCQGTGIQPRYLDRREFKDDD